MTDKQNFDNGRPKSDTVLSKYYADNYIVGLRPEDLFSDETEPWEIEAMSVQFFHDPEHRGLAEGQTKALDPDNSGETNENFKPISND